MSLKSRGIPPQPSIESIEICGSTTAGFIVLIGSVALGCKGLPGTNTLAIVGGVSVTKKEIFIASTPGGWKQI
jgi:hypothetical protein